MKKVILSLLIICIAAPAYSWDGVDSDTGESVEIGKGNLVRRGNDIEIFDYSDGTYKDVEVQSIRRNGSSVEVEVFDYNKGEFRTLDMDGDQH